MIFYKTEAVFDELNKYCHFAKEDDYMEVIKWVNGEGFDITIHSVGQTKKFSLTYGELEALEVLTKVKNG